HVLKVVQGDDRIRVYLGGIKVFDAKDRTFRGAGGIGLWSSGDSAAQFEDEPDLARMLARTLEEEQFAVDLALDGDEAYYKMTEIPYDAIVLDLMLPR